MVGGRAVAAAMALLPSPFLAVAADAASARLWLESLTLVAA